MPTPPPSSSGKPKPGKGPGKGAGKGLSKQLGPLKAWQWAIVAVVGVGLGLLIRKRLGGGSGAGDATQTPPSTSPDTGPTAPGAPDTSGLDALGQLIQGNFDTLGQQFGQWSAAQTAFDSQLFDWLQENIVQPTASSSVSDGDNGSGNDAPAVTGFYGDVVFPEQPPLAPIPSWTRTQTRAAATSAVRQGTAAINSFGPHASLASVLRGGGWSIPKPPIITARSSGHSSSRSSHAQPSRPSSNGSHTAPPSSKSAGTIPNGTVIRVTHPAVVPARTRTGGAGRTYAI